MHLPPSNRKKTKTKRKAYYHDKFKTKTKSKAYYHNKFKTVSRSSLTVVPKDLLTDILVRVASKSHVDYINAKKSCKDLHAAAIDNYIFANNTMENFPIKFWTRGVDKGAHEFGRRCFISGNSESLFRKGMVEYFERLNKESGLEFLKEAAKKMHMGATYVCGIILLYLGYEREGLDLLSSLNAKKSRRLTVITGCREKVSKTLSLGGWVVNKMDKQAVNTRKYCNCERPIKLREPEWDKFETHFDIDCESCFWNYEVVVFRKMNFE